MRNVGYWHIASFRGDAAIPSLSERSGHSASCAYRTGFMSTRPNASMFLRVSMVANRGIGRHLFLFTASYETSVLPQGAADHCKQSDGSGKEQCTGYDLVLVLLRQFVEGIEPYGEALTALSGVAVAFFTATMWWTTRRMWKANILQLRHSEDTAQRQLRAYIFVIKGIVQNVEAGKRAEVVIHIKNTGQTPAYDLQSWAAVDADDLPRLKPFFSNWGFETSGRKSPVGPGEASTVFLETLNPVLPDTITRMKSKRRAIWAYGQIRYRDAFNQSLMDQLSAGFRWQQPRRYEN